MEIIIAILGVGALLVIGSIWRGYVFSILWGWFAVPVFGLPTLSIAAAIGIAMLISFLVYQPQHYEDTRSDYQKIASAIGVVIFYPALVLLVGWVVTLFL